MKKTVLPSFFLALILCLSLFLTACGGVPKLGKETWSFVSVAQNGTPIYVAEEYADTVEDVPTLALSLTVEGDNLTLTDGDGTVFTGTYADREEISPVAADYRITLGESRGRALITLGEEKDGSVPVSLTLLVDDYAILFRAK